MTRLVWAAEKESVEAVKTTAIQQSTGIHRVKSERVNIGRSGRRPGNGRQRPIDSVGDEPETSTTPRIKSGDLILTRA